MEQLKYLLFTALYVAAAPSQKCHEAMSKFGQDVENKNYSPYLSYFMNSGSGINQFGDYFGCILVEKQQYGTLVLRQNTLNFVVQMGICFSTACSITEINEEDDYLQSLIKFIPNTNDTVYGPLLPLILTSKDVMIVDPFTYKPDKGPLFYFIIVLICIGILFSIARPIVSLIRSLTQKKPIIEKKQPAIKKLKKDDQNVGQIQWKLSWAQICQVIFKSFDFRNSWLHLINYQRNTSSERQTQHKPNIRLLTGYRVIAFVGTVFGLQFIFLATQAPNTFQTEAILKSWEGLLIASTMYCSDLFLWLSGFFMAKNLLDSGYAEGRNFIQQVQFSKWFLVQAILRFLRLYPSYFIAFLIYTNLAPHMGASVRWPALTISCQCDNYYNFFMISDLFAKDGPCIVQTWLINVEFQLYLSCLIFVYLYGKKYAHLKKLMLSIIAALILLNLVVSIVLELRVPVFLDKKQFDWYYAKPWSHAPVYLMGIFTGITYVEYLEYKDKKNSSIKGNFLIIASNFYQDKRIISTLVSYSLGILIILFVVFGYRTAQSSSYCWPILLQSIWWSLSFVVITIGFTFFALTGMVGRSDWVQGLMDNVVIRVLGKISFWGCLICLIEIQVLGYSFNQSYYLSVLDGIILFLQNFSVICFFATILSVYVELPYLSIRRFLISHWLSQFETDEKGNQNPLTQPFLEISQMKQVT